MGVSFQASNNSLLLIAIKLALDGKTMPDEQQFTVASSKQNFDENEVKYPYLDTFIDSLIYDVTTVLSNQLADSVDALKANLEIIKEVGMDPEDGIMQGMSINQAFDNGSGNFFIWMYLFVPNEQAIHTEILSCSSEIRLADKVIIKYNTRKTWFGKKKWEEKFYIPATINQNVVINALSAAFKPYVTKEVKINSQIIDALNEAAIAQGDVTETSDNLRRTVYNPTTRSRQLITDPALYSLIPPVWVSSSGDFSHVTYHSETDTYEVEI